MKIFLMLAAVFAFLGVGAGAFGAHALADLLKESGRQGSFETAVRYQMYHALALFGIALLKTALPNKGLLTWSGWLFVIGIVVFSGSLYLLVFSGLRWFGAITPLGGVAFLGGWVLLFLTAWRAL